MREAAQMVSYEVPLGIAILIGIMTAGTLNLVRLGWLQSGGLHTWLIFRNPFAFLAFGVYFVAGLASNKRAPFDLPESESELVAGFHTEYSGLRFSFFFFAEYASMFVVSGIQTSLFLGGWNDPLGLIGLLYPRFHAAFAADPSLGAALPLVLLNLVAVGIFILKCLAIVFVQMWIRWTLPRPRIDQVLYACIKVLLPMACVLLLGGALWQLFVPEMPGIPWLDYQPWHVTTWTSYGASRLAASITQVLLALIGLSIFTAVLVWIGYAFVTGRGTPQRLTDPDEIPELAANP
jgi:NADH-quinone oxidoreductase subunit H